MASCNRAVIDNSVIPGIERAASSPKTPSRIPLFGTGIIMTPEAIRSRGEFQRVTNEQLFEPDWITWRVKQKSQGPSAEPADRPGRDFQWPHSIVVDPKLSVDWSMQQTQSARCTSRAFLDGVLHGFGKP